MTPLEAAKKIGETDPTYRYSYYGSDCHDCLHCDGGELYVKDDAHPFGGGHRFVHDTDCLHLSMPKIVAALEAAEGLVKVEPDAIWQFSPEWQALVDALKGES